MVMLIATSLSAFSIVRNRFFRSLTGSSVGRHGIASHLPVVWSKLKATIKLALSHAVAVSLLTDAWTSAAARQYVGVAARYLTDDLEVRYVWLAGVRVLGSCSKTAISDILLTVCEDFGLWLGEGTREAGRHWNIARGSAHGTPVIAIASDGGSNFKSAIESLRGPLWKPCCSHKLHNAVVSALDKLDAASPVRLLLDVCKGVTEFFGGPFVRRKEALAEHLTAVSVDNAGRLQRAVRHRWSSQLRMLESVSKMFDRVKDALFKLSGVYQEASDLYQRLRAVDRNEIRQVSFGLGQVNSLMDYLQRFQSTAGLEHAMVRGVVHRIRGQADPVTFAAGTSLDFLLCDLLLTAWPPAFDAFRLGATGSGLEALLPCMAIEPGTNGFASLAEGIREPVKIWATDELEALSLHLGPGAPAQAGPSTSTGRTTPPPAPTQPMMFSPSALVSVGCGVSRVRGAEFVGATLRSELSTLQSMAPAGDRRYAAQFYRDHGRTLPRLRRLFQALGSTPTSTVYVESAWSVAGKIVTESSTRMSDEHFGRLLFLNLNSSFYIED